jgi:hypothetical protein
MRSRAGGTSASGHRAAARRIVAHVDETQAFLEDVMPRQLAAEKAMHEGDATE